MERTSDGLRPSDLVRFCIQANGLDKPISTCLKTVSEFTLEKLLAIVLKVLQSKDRIKLSDGFTVDVITVKRDVGAGRKMKVINTEIDRLRKQSIITVDKGDDGLCCAKAIVRAIAQLEGDTRAINALRNKRRLALLNRAEQLHEDAGVPLGPCTYSEIAVFENYLNPQIVVFSTTNSNKVSCKRDVSRPRRINLWLHDEHYEMITSLKAFYGSQFYCEEFDGQFIMSWLLDQGLTPEVIPNGSKVMSIKHSTLRINIIDSFSFLPMALAKLPSCFGNQNYVGSLPEPSFFSPDSMSIKGRDDFLKWYNERKKKEFNFRKKMIEYCRSDVDILSRCCNKFHDEMIKISGLDPFCYVTIASSCMAVYRSKHIQPDTIAMVPGCFSHGCPDCFDADTMHPLKKVTMGTLRKKTSETTEKLRSLGYELWEHRFQEMKKEMPAFRDFVRNHKMIDRLNPRDSYFGGRTNAVRLFYEGEAKYVDFTSLYPWVNKYCQYPVGHPQIITSNFEGIDNYFGIVKCKVFPPYSSNEKLMFPLCRTCADTLSQTTCTHAEEDRAIAGTWVTEEVKLAIYEVYHFEKSSKDLFRLHNYLFLKIKQESSGWPRECVTEEDKQRYLQEYFEKEGIKLDPENIEKNPSQRQVGDEPSLDTYNIKDIYFASSEIAAVQRETHHKFIEQDTATNVFIATFTTAWARIKLYSEMDKLGESVLYRDTDSIIYASNGDNDPPIGNFLGDFTDELVGDVITTFASGGAKNYAHTTRSGKTCCKVRVFSLNARNSEFLNFESVKHLVYSLDRETTILLHNPSKIVGQVKKRKVVNVAETKVYRMVYDKRVINPNNYHTLPYGY
ncbi:uncharacterized protein [Parasteatoda tepidariorum]|uniref:uncharacterized protein n=1 Tax=Parasteatoda tepidariorum TaxID=114398 RepID=UPI0039BC277E